MPKWKKWRRLIPLHDDQINPCRGCKLVNRSYFYCVDLTFSSVECDLLNNFFLIFGFCISGGREALQQGCGPVATGVHHGGELIDANLVEAFAELGINRLSICVLRSCAERSTGAVLERLQNPSGGHTSEHVTTVFEKLIRNDRFKILSP